MKTLLTAILALTLIPFASFAAEDAKHEHADHKHKHGHEHHSGEHHGDMKGDMKEEAKK